jgi:hypothetical protein
MSIPASHQGLFYNFPDDMVVDKNPASEHGKKFWVQAAKAIYATGLGNGLISQNSFAECRMYGEGNQPKEKYLPVIDPYFSRTQNTVPVPDKALIEQYSPRDQQAMGKMEQDKKGFTNTDFRIHSIAPKVGRIIHGLLSEQGAIPKVESKSPQHINEKLRQKNESWFTAKYGGFFEEITKKTGAQFPKPGFVPKSRAEMDIYEAQGGFKVVLELALEKIIAHGFDISDYTTVIEPRLIADLRDYNIASLRDYTDKRTGAAKITYQSPDRLKAQYDEDKNFDASPFWAYVEFVSIKQLRDEILQCGCQENISETTLQNLASNHSQARQMQGFENGTWKNMDPILLNFQYDYFLVPVLRFEYLTKGLRHDSIGTDKEGNLKYWANDEVEKGDFTEEYEKKRNKKRVKISYNVRYQGTWIIGTEDVYDVHPAYNTKRENRDTVMSDFHAYKILGTSITHNVISLYDRLQQIHLKYQQHIIHALPPGIAVDFTMMSEATIGGARYDVFDFLRIYGTSGNLLYSTGIRNGKIVNNGKPFEKLENGLGRAFTEWVGAYTSCIQEIFETTGITQAAQASSNISGEKGLGVQQMEVQATNNNLYPLKIAIKHLKERSAKALCLRAMTSICFDPVSEEYYKDIIGDNGVAAIKQLIATQGGLTLEKLNIIIEEKPDSLFAQTVMRAAEQAMQPTKDGVPGLTYDQYFEIVTMVKNNQIDDAKRYLGYCIDKNKKDHQESVRANMEAQGEDNRKTATVASQLKEEEEKKKHEREIDKIVTQEKEKRKTIMLQEAEKRKTAVETANIKAQQKTEATS